MEIAPRRSLKNTTLKNALKANVVSVIIKRYQAIAVRALWETTDDPHRRAELLVCAKRAQLQSLILNIEEVVGCISCVTALTLFTDQEKVERKKREGDKTFSQFMAEGSGDETTAENRVPGIAFWIMVDTHFNIAELESRINRVILSGGLNISSSKIISARGEAFTTLFSFMRGCM